MLALVFLVRAILAATPAASASARLHDDPERVLGAVGGGEPSIQSVQAAAGRQVERESHAPEAFARRARLAALVPRVTAEYRRDERMSRVVGLQGSGEVDYLHLAPGTTFIVRATWDLGSLVAARGELAAAQGDADRTRRATAAVRRATELFFERRRAMVALILDPPSGARARADAEIQLDQLTAELDALTGGLYTRGDQR